MGAFECPETSQGCTTVNTHHPSGGSSWHPNAALHAGKKRGRSALSHRGQRRQRWGCHDTKCHTPSHKTLFVVPCIWVWGYCGGIPLRSAVWVGANSGGKQSGISGAYAGTTNLLAVWLQAGNGLGCGAQVRLHGVAKQVPKDGQLRVEVPVLPPCVPQCVRRPCRLVDVRIRLDVL